MGDIDQFGGRKEAIISVLDAICRQGSAFDFTSLDLAMASVYSEALLEQGCLDEAFPEDPERRCRVNASRALNELRRRVVKYSKDRSISKCEVQHLEDHLIVDVEKGCVVLTIPDGTPAEIGLDELDGCVGDVKLRPPLIAEVSRKVMQDAEQALGEM